MIIEGSIFIEASASVSNEKLTFWMSLLSRLTSFYLDLSKYLDKPRIDRIP